MNRMSPFGSPPTPHGHDRFIVWGSGPWGPCKAEQIAALSQTALATAPCRADTGKTEISAMMHGYGVNGAGRW
jgi:hypothetical protein